MKNRNYTMMTARALLSIALAVVLLLSHDPAMAWGNKKKEPKNQATKAVNRDKHPTMKFFNGVLRLDTHGGWYLNQKPMSFNKNSRITDTPGSSGGTELIEGCRARVTAASINGTLIVHRVTMISPDKALSEGGFRSGGADGELEAASSDTPK